MSAVAATTAKTAASILLAENPAISIRMTASPEQFTAAGQAISYTYHVENTGDVSLDPVTVTDPLQGLTGLTCTAAVLVSQTSLTCVAHYVTTSADVALGHVANSATVTGLSPLGVQLRAPAEVTIPLAAPVPPAARPPVVKVPVQVTG